MSTAKSIIYENLTYISDDINDEFVVLENLYKLLRLRKSQEDAEQGQVYTTDEVKDFFAHNISLTENTEAILDEADEAAASGSVRMTHDEVFGSIRMKLNAGR